MFAFLKVGFAVTQAESAALAADIVASDRAG